MRRTTCRFFGSPLRRGCLADVYYEALRVAEVPKLRRVGGPGFSASPGLDVSDVRQVKRLEFGDVVISTRPPKTTPRSSNLAT